MDMKKILSEKHILFQSIVIAAALILLCVPCFQMTGKVIMPLFIALFGSAAVCMVSSLLRDSETSIGLSLVILDIFWFVSALIGEYKVQKDYGFQSYWIQYFYFDKLLVVGGVWLGSSLFVSFNRIFNKKKSLSDFNLFYKYSSYAFIGFYAFILIYSFVLIRLDTGDYPFRFQPFVTIGEYIEKFAEIPYEILMNVLGNLFFFTPLGYIFLMLLSDKNIKIKVAVNLLFPIMAFTLLEFSQFFFRVGYCEFDDMMMNSIGFWFGNILCFVCNAFSAKISNGRVNRFWN